MKRGIDVDHTTLNRWVYQYLAIDKFGKTLDFMLSERCDEAAATAFFKRIIETSGIPDKVTNWPVYNESLRRRVI